MGRGYLSLENPRGTGEVLYFVKMITKQLDQTHLSTAIVCKGNAAFCWVTFGLPDSFL